MIKNDVTFKNLIKVLKENNIRDIVISPGGTNIRFVKLVQDDPFFTCYSIIDERSAVYFAIGLYLQTGRIIAMSCTSAQATRNYIPGLTEAFYKKVPILAITMSKHPRFTYQEYMQAPDQTSLPRDCVKKSFAVPFVSDENDLLHANRLINEAILELTNGSYAPVQLCIPALDRELVNLSNEIKIIRSFSFNDINDLIDELKNKKVMIVVGEHRKIDEKFQRLLEMFAEKYNSVIYTNHLSNYYGSYSFKGNLLLSVLKPEEFSKIKPDVLISIGGQTGDYPFYNMLSRTEFSDIEHWRIDSEGKVVDTYDKLTKIIRMSEYDFFFEMTECSKNNKNTTYYEYLSSLVENKNVEIDVPFSNIYAAQVLSKKIKSGSSIQFSILNSLRVWNLFSLNDNIDCYSNVGAFGIDGGMSTLIGQSVVSEKDCYLIIGDLAFLYDINSLSIRHIKNNLKILLINNNGGVEFKLYKDADSSESTNRYIAAGGHFSKAEGWATDCGFTYLSASSKKEFECYVDQFVDVSDKPIIFELFVNDTDDVDAYKKIIRYNSDNKIEDMLDETKNKVKKIIKGIISK